MRQKSKTPLNEKRLGRGALLALVLSIALYLNFLVTLGMGIFAMGLLLLEPAFGIITGVFLLLGLIGIPVSKHMNAGKLWRRLLMGAVILNFLSIALYCLVCIAMILAW